MRALILRRLLQLPLILVVVYAVTALLLVARPGDPLAATERADPRAEAALRHKYGFDRPWYERYFWRYPRQLLLHGDLPSMAYPDWTVREVIGGSFPVSLQLGAFALAVAVLAGTLLGVLGAALERSPIDYAALAVAVVGISLPLFVIAEIGLILFAVLWPLVPLGGWGGPRTLLLPGLVLALPFMAYIARLTRSAMLEVLTLEFVRTARAKGAAPAGVILDHAFRNAFLPVLSYLGPAAAGIFTGSFVVEKIFRIPGLGTHFVQSALNGDQTLALAIVMLYAVLLVAFNLLVDVCYAAIDPRIRLAGGRAA